VLRVGKHPARVAGLDDDADVHEYELIGDLAARPTARSDDG